MQDVCKLVMHRSEEPLVEEVDGQIFGVESVDIIERNHHTTFCRTKHHRALLIVCLRPYQLYDFRAIGSEELPVVIHEFHITIYP